MDIHLRGASKCLLGIIVGGAPLLLLLRDGSGIKSTEWLAGVITWSDIPRVAIQRHRFDAPKEKRNARK